MSKRQAGWWAKHLCDLGFYAYRNQEEDECWTVWCSDTADGGEHFWEAGDVRRFLRWAEGQGIA